MGKHSEWRKIAKKLRRKRIRQALAQERDVIEEEEQRRRENSPSYQKWLEEHKIEEEFQAEEEARIKKQREAEWIRAEIEAQKQWVELQKKLEAAREERAKQITKIKLEWENEQKRLREIKEQKERELEEKQRQLDLFKKQVDDFIEHGGDTPEHLKLNLETNPKKDPCPFFQKTSACRFYDVCSRNHIRPGVSRILLIPNFYSHFSLEKPDEQTCDSGLEFDSHETYEHFREFFFDVVPELEKCGHINNVKICCNHEAHLRGNVYVEYASTRAALKGYRIFNGRWYAGKQLNVEFCNIISWKTAICGLYYYKRCPKGNACNFLHVFRNPQNLYSKYDTEFHHERKLERHSSQRREWRWSESPERFPQNMEWDDDISKHKKLKNTYSNGGNHAHRNGSRSSRSRRHKNSKSTSKYRSRSRSRSPSRLRRKRSRSRSSTRSHKSKVYS